MSAERLSRLQKWILEFLYSQENKGAYLINLKYHARREFFKPDTNRKSIDVTISRSLRNLYFYGGIENLIELCAADACKEVRMHGGRGNVFDDPKGHGNLKLVWLTEKGEDKTKGLLNVKNGELNNKKEDNGREL